MGLERRINHIIIHLVLAIGALVMVLPFVWMILTSLKPDSEILTTNWIPHHWIWSNYIRAWRAAPFGTFWWNSTIVTVLATLGQMITSAFAGFAFSKIRFFGRNTLLMVILAALMIPLQSIIIPLYLVLVHLHWVNSLVGLIVPMVPSAFGTFLFKQFFDGIPTELEEAALMDGAGRYRILFSIFLPLSKPVVAAFGLLSFLFNWNNFFYPLIVVSSTKVQTLPLGLATFSSGNLTQYNLLMAATALTIIPVFILFLFVQKYFVEGIAITGIK